MIEDRWHLNPGEGAAQLFLGNVTDGMLGGGFLYTNKESISLGVVVGMKAMRERAEKIKPRDPSESYELLDRFKALTQIKPLVAGGTVAEYSAHAIPEGGIAAVPKLAGDGYLMAGDAAGLALNALITVRGMDFAIASGYYAAETVKAAKARGDFSAAGLAGYEASLRGSFVLKDLETAQPDPRLHGEPAPLHALPACRLPPARADLHGRSRPHAGALQDGVGRHPPRLHEHRHRQGRLVGAQDLR